MNRLPNELCSQICEYTEDTYTLKALRLTQKRLSAVATPHLFRCLYIYFHPDSLGKLLDLSQTYLAKHVRTVIYLVHIFHSKTLEEYIIACRCDLAGNERVAEPLRHNDAEAYYADYQRFCEGQSSLITSNNDYGILTAAFSNFSWLKNVKIITLGHVPRHSQPRQLPNNSFFQRILMYPQLAHKGYSPREGSRPHVGSRHLIALLHAAASAGLKLHSVTWEERCGGLLELSDASLAMVKTALKHARRIGVGYVNTTMDGTDVLQAGKLGEVLCSVEGLRSLEIRSCYPFLLREVTLAKVLGTKEWSKLEELSLGRFFTHERPFMAFLDQCTTRLVSLRLEDCKLLSGTWLSVIKQLRSRFHLKHVEFIDMRVDAYTFSCPLVKSCTHEETIKFFVQAQAYIVGKGSCPEQPVLP